jgi:hypothetical protein
MKRRLTFFLSSTLLVATLLWAASQGPNNPTLGVNVAGGGVNWANPTNIYASDDARGTAALAASGYSDYLRATGFGFTIPAGATINGIVVGIERSYTGTGTCEDLSVKIVKGGTETGTEKASGAWPTPDDFYDSFGIGTTDLWGTAWTVADINAADFGVSVSATETSGTDTVSARVDHMRITVYYTTAGGVAKRQILNAATLHPAPMQRCEVPLPVGASIPLDVDSRGLLFAHVGLNGHDRLFWVDTGAPTAVSRDLGIPTIGKRTLQTATAFKTVLANVEFARVTLYLGGQHVERPVVVSNLTYMSEALERKVDGVLGYDTLRLFRRVCFDFGKGELTLGR